MNLATIIETLSQYRIGTEYQFVGGSIERQNKIIYLDYPYTAEDLIHELYHAIMPKVTDEDRIERMSQNCLKRNKHIREYLQAYLDCAMRGLH